ncbi:MAG: DMT family transporter [Proteobacteria bacterium]|nr:DMT family transporter [Pseudomonadota bacterium]
MKADILNNSAPFFSRSSQLRGLVCMIVASLMFSLMNVCVYAIGLCDPQLPSTVVSFVRLLINLIILLVPAVWAGDCLGLFGDLRLSLWLRGLFGSLALMLSFASIQMIGPGESAFLAASSVIFVALLGPLVLNQKNSALVWLAILGAMAGVALLFEPRFEGDDFLGRSLALGTGLLAALAYLMVAKAGRSNTTESVIFYFCLIGVAIHLAYFGFHGYQLPASADVWILLLAGGISASIAQFFLTVSYQIAPAALVSAASYLSPVLSLVWGVVLFSRVPDSKGLVGCGLVLFFGVLLPFLGAAGKK